MLEHIIYILPIVILLTGSILLTIFDFQTEQNSRCFKLCKWILLLSFALTIIFYNKPIINGITSANRYLVFFQSLLYIGALIVLYLSRKWFISAKQPAQQFCYGLLLTVLSGELLIVSRHLALTVGAVILAIYGYSWLLKNAGSKKQNNQIALIYVISGLVCSICLVIATAVLYWHCGVLSYTQLATCIEINRHQLPVFIATIVLIFGFLFLLGMAPLHYWFTEILGNVRLPIFSLFILLPSCAYWIGFLRLNLKLLAFITPSLQLFYIGIAFFSLAIGAIGAGSCRNLRKILAYSVVFQYGLMMLVLQNFNVYSVFVALFYWVIFILTMYALCSILFGLKNKGDYMFMLNEFSGLGHKKPFLAAVLTLLTFSLMGFPPLFGFAGLFSIFNYLILSHHYYQIVYIVVMLMVLGYAYLQTVKSLYFDGNKEILDRTDVGIYVLITAILGVLFVFLLHSAVWFDDLNLLVEAIAA